MHTKSTTRKRTHLKPSQVAILQETFVNNTLPDAAVRAQLAQTLDVTERTVQIWFQNRRAKARKLETLSPDNLIPSLTPNVRTGWVDIPKQLDLKLAKSTPRPRSTSRPVSSALHTIKNPKRAFSEGIGSISSPSSASSLDQLASKAMVFFPIQHIRIGSWARFSDMTFQANQWDLSCYSHPDTRQFIWQVKDGGHQFRIEVSYDHVQQIRLSEVQLDIGQLELLVATASFAMQRQGLDRQWVRCNDFTEHQQASQGMTMHILQGSHGKLRQALLELVSQSPELASKLVIAPHSFVLSPSTTPEPVFYPMIKSNTAWHSMLQQKESPVSPASTSIASSWPYWYSQRQDLVHAASPPSTEDMLSSFI